MLIYLGLYLDWSSLLGERREGRLQTINSDLHVTLLWVTAQVDGIVPWGAWSDLVVFALKLVATQSSEILFDGEPVQ